MREANVTIHKANLALYMSPPDGNYCFVDWDDLAVGDRRSWLYDRYRHSWSNTSDFFPGSDEAAKAETLGEAKALILAEIYVMALVDHTKWMLKTGALKDQMDALGKTYLSAMPGEAETMLRRNPTATYSSPEPLPVGTMVRISRHGLTGAKAGEMVMGVVIGQPVPTSKRSMNGLVLYEITVVMK